VPALFLLLGPKTYSGGRRAFQQQSGEEKMEKSSKGLQSVSDDDGTPYVRHCKFVGLVTRTELENVFMCTWRNFLN
jgi:hypothetical protein